MFHRISLFALAIPLLSSVAVTAVQETASEKDLKSLQGKWHVVSAKSPGGFNVGPDDNLFIIFEGNKLKVSKIDEKGEFRDGGTFSLDASKTPKAMDSITDVKLKIAGIYELTGDDLKICQSLSNEPRPTEFSSTAKN